MITSCLLQGPRLYSSRGSVSSYGKKMLPQNVPPFNAEAEADIEAPCHPNDPKDPGRDALPAALHVLAGRMRSTSGMNYP